MTELRFLLAAGGTGGHLWPALSLAQALKKSEPRSDCLFVGAGRPLEAAILDPSGFRRIVLKAGAWKGLGFRDRLRGALLCVSGFKEALALLWSYRPQVCFGAGGYVTVPVGLAAWFMGVPLVIHEQNSRAGLSNKFLGLIADRVMLGFREAAGYFPAGKTVVTGNPIRPEIASLEEWERTFERRPLTVLVTGGSQGALGLNQAVAPALVKIVKSGSAINIIHQAGASGLNEVRRIYDEGGVAAEVGDFFPDMASLYRQADLVVGRAGAITLTELTAARLPAILVPLPTAADDHQTQNARCLEAAGAAVVLPQSGLTSDILADALNRLLNRPEELIALSRAAAVLERREADARMAEICLNLVGRSVFAAGDRGAGKG